MHSFLDETNLLKRIIHDEINHSYIEKFIQKPLIDHDKLSILNYLYERKGLSYEKKTTYITTVMLVQIALDTHDNVSVDNENKTDETAQQLTVLAGDYYSGLYYLLLSKLEDITFIRMLATTIKQINELKMDLYYFTFDTVVEMLQALKEVEAILYTNTAKMLAQPQEVISVIELVLFLKRLEKEFAFLDVDSSYFAQCIEKRNDFSKATIQSEIEMMLEQIKKQLTEKLMHLPYEYDEFKQYVTDTYLLSYKPSIAREG